MIVVVAAGRRVRIPWGRLSQPTQTQKKVETFVVVVLVVRTPQRNQHNC